MELILQEVSQDRWIAIPDPVREIYALWRPTPLHRALGFEQALGTDCKIFYKWEGSSPVGSHKPNTAVAQAYYNAEAGVRRLATETGAGQWGSSLAFACQLFGLECKVYMVRVSYDSKPYRRVMIETWGGECVASPSPGDERRARDPGRAPGHDRQRSGSRSPRRWRTPRPARTRSTRWAACSTTCCCTRR